MQLTKFTTSRDSKTTLNTSNLFSRAGHRKYKVGLNQFTDLTNEEFKASCNGFKPKPSHVARTATSCFRCANVTSAPANMDWRTKGAVTPIKDHGQCRCCWAFSAVAAAEGITKLSTGKLISLSEQELVECDIGGMDEGCNGGLLMDTVFHFIVQNGGLATEASYPYKVADGTCITKKSVATTTGHEDVPAKSESSILKAVTKQPVSAAIDAGGSDSSTIPMVYSRGCAELSLTMVSLLLAMGQIKNSWGTSWVEKEYINIQRNVDAEEGLYGIAMQASYPAA